MTELNTLQSNETTPTKISESSVLPTTSYRHAPPPAIRVGSKLTDSPLPSAKLVPRNGSDPLGKNQHEAGAKLDAGKNRLDLVLGDFSRALWEVGRVGTYGANKYTDRGWVSVPNGLQRYGDALLRHYLQYKRGEAFDPESDLHHLAHAAWNALALLERTLREREVDGKPA